jgi:hypothetical protein
MVTTDNAAAEKIKKLEETIAKKKALLIREKGRISEKERRAKVRKLVELGGLADMAGLIDSDRGFLLGVLLEVRDISPTSDKYQELKDKGDSVLNEREKARIKKNG